MYIAIMQGMDNRMAQLRRLRRLLVRGGRGVVRVRPDRAARFWFEGAWITLKPGQQLHHHYQWHNGEGYSFNAWVLEHAGDCIELTYTSGGWDCDGPLSADQDSFASQIIDGHADWKQTRHDVTDVYAQAMGY